jgi:hypothetical protein
MRLVMHPLDPIRLCDLDPEARRQERAWRASVRSGDLIATPARPAIVIGEGLARGPVERSAPDTEGIERVLDAGSVRGSST